MTPSIHVDKDNGSVELRGHSYKLRRGASQAKVEDDLRTLHAGSQDYGNGYSWVYLAGLTLGDMPCRLGLSFHEKKLQAVHFHVELPNAPMKDKWPTQEAIDAEIAFARRVLGAQLNRRLRGKGEEFSWGVAWCDFDQRGFMATTGIRYK